MYVLMRRRHECGLNGAQVYFPRANEAEALIERPRKVAWSPETHRTRFPPAFRESIRALRLVHRRLQVRENKRSFKAVGG